MAALLVLLVTTAQAATPADEAARAFKRGRELLQRGLVAEACLAFEESWRLDPALGALLNLAECNVKLGRRARGWDLYGEVLAWAVRTGHAQREAIARERLAALRAELALLVVEGPPDVEALVSGQRYLPGQTVPLEPGPVEVEFRRDGRLVSSTNLVARAGETIRAAPEPPAAPIVETPPPPPVLLPAAPAEVVAPAARTPERMPRAPVGPLVLASAGALVAVASAVAMGWSVDVWNRGETQRLGGALTVTRETYQTASVVYPVSWAGLLGGLAAVSAGLVWWLVFPSFGRAP